MTRRTTVLIAFLVVALAALAFSILWQPSVETAESSGSGLKVIVLGVDGLDWFILRQYATEGRLPNIGQLIGRGVLGSIEADLPVAPCIGWTQLGNGTRLSEESLLAIGDLDGRSIHTGVPGVARALAASGGSCLTVGWPGTWPLSGDESGGTILAPYAPDAPSHELSLARALLASGAGQALPGDLASRVDRTLDERLESWIGAFGDEILEPGEEIEGWEPNVLAARWSYVADRTTLDLAAGLITEFEPEVALVHLSGLDAVGHRFVAPGMPEFFPGLPGDVAERYGEVLPGYYEFIDSAVRRLRRLSDDRTVFILCSAYGTHPIEGDLRLAGSHERGAPGVFVAVGPDVAPVPAPIELSTIDVAPTLLALVGRPIPSDLDGRIITQATPAGHLQITPPAYTNPLGLDVVPEACSTGEMESRAAARRERLSGE